MAKLLTLAAIQRLKPHPVKRREIADAAANGLYLVIQPEPTGAKTWAYRYRLNGKSAKLTLGAVITLPDGEKEPAARYGEALTLVGARELARKAATDIARGISPARAKEAQHDKSRDLFKTVAADFLRKHCAGKRTARNIERIIKVYVLPHWSERSIQSITKRDAIELLDRVSERAMQRGGKGVMANRVFSVIRKLFGWAVNRDVLQASPCVGVEAPVTEFRRDRVLSDNELRTFWKACDELGYPFGPLFQLLLLTGTRLREVSEMTQGELNLADRLWTIPRERAKNNQVHIVPLSDAALQIIEALPQIVSKPGYLFTTTGTRLSSFSRAKMMLDQRMRKIAPEVEVSEWHLHDLRRTCATGLQRLGIRFEVTEAVLNHLSGSKGGVAGIYQRHDWKAEKAAALQAWGRFVMALVSDQPATNVAVLRPVA